MFSKHSSVGLVLGGGGARGFFHVGVIKAIQKLGIKISKVSGTSIGAVVGVLYATNPQIDMENLASELDYFTIIKTMAFKTRESSTLGVEALLRSYVPQTDFSELKIPFVFNAVDINKKREVVFDSGELFPGLLATIAIPGIFPPVEVDGKFLVDGGVINNVPISLIKDTDELIVSDITGPIKEVSNKSLAIDVLYSSVALMQHHIAQEEIKKAKTQKIDYLNLDDDEIFILDFRKENYMKLIDRGYEAMMDSYFELKK